MKILPRRLRTITLCFSAFFLISIVATGVAVHHMTRNAIVSLVDERISDAAAIAAGPPQTQSADKVLQRIRMLSSRRETGDIGFELEDAKGRWLGGNISLGRSLPLGRTTLSTAAGIRGFHDGRALVRQLEDGLRLTVVAETEPVDRYNSMRSRPYLIGFGSIILVVVGGIAAFGLLVRRRISELRKTAAAIVDGDLHRRVPVSGAGGEFDKQAIALNGMLDSMSDLMQGLRNISNDVAHDLRTPLTRLRSRLVLMSRQPSAGPLESDIAQAIDQCDDILALLGAILRIAEVEGGARRASFEPIELGKLARDATAAMRSIIEDQGKTLDLFVGEAIWIEGDRQLLVQALFNLIENAMRYSSQGSNIGFAVKPRHDGAALIVRDDGPGIPAEQREIALRRFGRLDSSRHSPGYGLGLPLVSAIARLHGGRLELGEADPGLAAQIWLPHARSNAGAELGLL